MKMQHQIYLHLLSFNASRVIFLFLFFILIYVSVQARQAVYSFCCLCQSISFECNFKLSKLCFKMTNGNKNSLKKEKK